MENNNILQLKINKKIKKNNFKSEFKKNAPSEARTHDLQITQKMLFNSDYETDALTNCATEALVSGEFFQFFVIL